MDKNKINDIAIIKILFESVEDKPGYYWLNKRNYQIIPEEVLKKAIKEYIDKNNKNIIKKG